MSLRSLLSAANRRMLCSVYRRTVSLGDRGPIVSFGFDDFPRSAYLVAGRILEDHGARGTYYTAVGLMHHSNGLGDMFRAQDLCALLQKGHEIGTQTLNHASCRGISIHDFQGEVEEGIEAVERLTGHHPENFAYAYGHVSISSKKALEPLVASSRGIIPGINGPEIDLNLLRANRIYGDMQGAWQLNDLVQQNVRQKGWLIFYTHDVCPNPSIYGCTPELFEFAVSAAARSRSRILTVQQALNELDMADRIATTVPANP